MPCSYWGTCNCLLTALPASLWPITTHSHKSVISNKPIWSCPLSTSKAPHHLWDEVQMSSYVKLSYPYPHPHNRCIYTYITMLHVSFLFTYLWFSEFFLLSHFQAVNKRKICCPIICLDSSYITPRVNSNTVISKKTSMISWYVAPSLPSLTDVASLSQYSQSLHKPITALATPFGRPLAFDRYKTWTKSQH